MALVAVAALLLAFLAIRSAVVQVYARRQPETAALLWPGHPTVLLQTALGDIGRAAAAGRAPSPATLDKVRSAALRAPLLAEPFLVEGTSALSRGDRARARRLLEEAVSRDPRLPGARFLLADVYLQQGRTEDGLRQIAALVRRLPRAADPLVPSLAQFAKQPAAVEQVRAIFARNPPLRDKVLTFLADDPANAGLVLELAPAPPSGAAPQDWQVRLVSGLVRSGEYRQAYALWTRFSGAAAPANPGLFNPRFERLRAAPPFNWVLANGSAGVAEPAEGGGLHVLFYGREDTVLAAQVLLLQPGSYSLRTSAAPAAPANLSWVINCLPANSSRAREPVSAEALRFTVPTSGCPAQELQLRGSLTEAPSTVEVTIRELRLEREASR